MNLHQQAREFTLQWIRNRHGSAVDYLIDLERELGWPARLIVSEVVEALRKDSSITKDDHKFVVHTLNQQVLQQALLQDTESVSEHQSAIDELFARSRNFRDSHTFKEAVEFVAKFRDYSPLNNILVYSQNPFATYVATAKQWFKNFHRTIKENARPIVILAPHAPVLFVYDVEDTEGPKLPAKFEMFGKTSGRFDPCVFQKTLKNCEREKILIERRDLPALRAGIATMRMRTADWKARIWLRHGLDEVSAYPILCHELAHIFLGHLGASKKCNWPYRPNVSNAVAEIEAEAAAYIVCKRAGLKTQSVEYLSSYMDDSSELENVSLDLISRVAGRIEEMGQRLLPPR